MSIKAILYYGMTVACGLMTVANLVFLSFKNAGVMAAAAVFLYIAARSFNVGTTED